MCLIALSVKKSKDWNSKTAYFFDVVANRDEYHERPTLEMHWWENNILAGIITFLVWTIVWGAIMLWTDNLELSGQLTIPEWLKPEYVAILIVGGYIQGWRWTFAYLEKRNSKDK